MAFSQMLEILKKKEKGNIIFIKLGTFYILVEKYVEKLKNGNSNDN